MGELNLVDVSSNPKFSSPVWKMFLRICDGKARTDFAICKTCDEVSTHAYLSVIIYFENIVFFC